MRHRGRFKGSSYGETFVDPHDGATTFKTTAESAGPSTGPGGRAPDGRCGSGSAGPAQPGEQSLAVEGRLLSASR